MLSPALRATSWCDSCNCKQQQQSLFAKWKTRPMIELFVTRQLFKDLRSLPLSWHCVSHDASSANNNNNNNQDNVYGAVIHGRAIARVHPVHLMNVEWRQLSAIILISALIIISTLAAAAATRIRCKVNRHECSSSGDQWIITRRSDCHADLSRLGV